MGILDFMQSPEGLGLISGVAGYAANARRGTPINNIGRGLAAGVGGYQNAQNFELTKSYKTLQEQMMQAQMAQAQTKLDRDQELQKTIGSVLGQMNQPQTETRMTDVTLDPAQRNGVALNMSGGTQARDDYAKWVASYDAKVAAGQKPSADETMIYDQIKSRVTPVYSQVQTPVDQASVLRNLGTQVMALNPNMGKGFLEASSKYEPKPISAGSFLRDPVSGKMTFVADPTKGVSTDANGNVTLMPGAQNLAVLAGMTKRAEQEAAGYNPIDRAKVRYETGVDPVSLLGGQGYVEPQGLPQKLLNEVKAAGDKANAEASGKSSAEANTSLVNAQGSLPQLEKTVSQLSDLGKKATFTKAGQARDSIARQLGFATEGAIAREKYIQTVRDVLFPQLRQTFGAQFTVKEGEALIATMGDPDKTPEEKDAALSSFIDQKKQHLGTLQRQSDGQSNNQAEAAVPQRIKNNTDYDALPSGAMFIDPFGKTRRKP